MIDVAKVSVTVFVVTLADLEALCRSARAHGMGDRARIPQAQDITVQEEHVIGSANASADEDPWADEPQTQEATE